MIEQYCETDGLQVHLIPTIGKLMQARSQINGVLEKILWKADFEQIVEMKRQAEKHDEAIGYLQEIQAAFEKRKLVPTDLLSPYGIRWALLMRLRSAH